VPGRVGLSKAVPLAQRFPWLGLLTTMCPVVLQELRRACVEELDQIEADLEGEEKEDTDLRYACSTIRTVKVPFCMLDRGPSVACCGSGVRLQGLCSLFNKRCAGSTMASAGAARPPPS
jgi:hypothetical protein